MDRTIGCLVLYYYGDVISTPPNRCGYGYSDDYTSLTYLSRIVHKSSLFLLILIHEILYYDVPCSYTELLWLTISTLGSIIALLSYQQLNRFYTFELCVQHQHYLIRDGMYSKLAHPGYLGQNVYLLSTIFFCHISCYLTIILTFYIVYRLLIRIRNEEEMMNDHFKSSYQFYLKERYRLIPYIY